MLKRTSLLLMLACPAACPLHAPRALAQQSANKTSPFNIMEATVPQIQAAMLSGRLTAHQLVQDYLDRIAAYDKKGPNLNCVVTTNPQALADADKLDRALKTTGKLTGPLHGVPILVKDEIDTVGMPTTLGSLIFKDYRPTRDAFVVTNLRQQGAIILGKATMSEFAGGDTYGSGFAEPGEAYGVTRNPYDPTRTAGGSSGGSGACLAANFSTLTVGEETNASLRRPGGWNDVVAMRPTAGLVSRSGMYDGWPTESATIGPMSRTVADLARLMDIMVQYDPEDPLTALGVGHKPPSYLALLNKSSLKGARIGVLRTNIGSATDPTSAGYKNVLSVFNQTVAELKSAGAIVVDPIEIPGLQSLLKIRGTLPSLSEQALELWLARNPTSKIHSTADIANSPDADKIFPPRTKTTWLKETPPDDLKQYGAYLVARQTLMINLLKVMADQHLDAIVYRTVEHSATPISEGVNPPYLTSKGVPTFNTFLVYVPAITVPSGFTPDGMPTGITFMGRPYSDAEMLTLAYSYEQATHHRVPPKLTPPLPAK